MTSIWQTNREELREQRRYRCDAELPANKDIALLARLIFAEAAGESTLGKEAVGCVVRNRVEAPPKTQERIWQWICGGYNETRRFCSGRR